MPENKNLESRMAIVETGLQVLTREVGDLVSVVRVQADNTNKQIAALSTSVERAAAPRATNWQTMFAGIALMMTIGGGIWFVLQERISRSVEDTEKVDTRMTRFRESFAEHEKQEMHPVGLARVQALEKASVLAAEHLTSMLDRLDSKLQKEFQLANDNTSQQTKDLDTRLQREFGLTSDRVNARLEKLERWNYEEKQADEAELRQWRLKAMKGPIQ